jgi:hypothetical protein
MLLCRNNALKQKTSLIHDLYRLHVLLYNAAKLKFKCKRFGAFVIKQSK